jgi:hypothetical protein
MPRQTYISKEFFVNASEKETKQHVLDLPNSISNIKFVAEDDIRHNLKFVYQGINNSENSNNCISVSLLPLSTNQTMISLQGSTSNGSAFHRDHHISNALTNFELAVNAAIVGALPQFQPKQIKRENSSLHISLLTGMAIIAGFVYFTKGWW